MVLLIAPIVNPDGNERVVEANDGGRNGPPSGVGQHRNASGVDLHRDHMALRSTETRAVVKMLVDYDPHVSIDLHTAADACSAYTMTYAPPLHPSTSDRILSTLKNDWLPFVTKNLKSNYAANTFYQGRVEGGDDGCTPVPAPPPEAAATDGPSAAGTEPAPAPAVPEPTPPEPDDRAWASLDYTPGLQANYLGLRNRFGLLGASYAYAGFEDRIDAIDHFLNAVLTFAYGAEARLRRAVDEADDELIVGEIQVTRSRPADGGRIEILMGGVEEVSDPETGEPEQRRLDVATPVQMIDRIWYLSASDEMAAAEYYVPVGLTAAVELLRAHGIRLRELAQPTVGVEEFAIATREPIPGVAGGQRLTGDWQPADAAVSVPAGTWVVRMNQPLARLAFALLEPASEDGLAATAAMEDVLKDAETYPILRRR